MFQRQLISVVKLFFYGILLSLFVAACTKSTPPPEPMEDLPPPAPEVVEHTVQYPGETLGLISRWYTGKSSNWEAILSMNPGMDPRRINLGNVILIPAELVVKDSPLPQSFVGSVVPSDADVKVSEGEEPKASESDVDNDSSAVSSLEDSSPDQASVDQDEAAAKEKLRKELEAALAAEVEADAALAEQAGKETAAKAEDESMTADEIDRDRLLDELLAE